LRRAPASSGEGEGKRTRQELAGASELAPELVDRGADGPLLRRRGLDSVQDRPEDEASAKAEAEAPPSGPIVPVPVAVEDILSPGPARASPPAAVPVVPMMTMEEVAVAEAVVAPSAPARSAAVTGGPAQMVADDPRHYERAQSSQNQATDHVDLLL